MEDFKVILLDWFEILVLKHVYNVEDLFLAIIQV